VIRALSGGFPVNRPPTSYLLLVAIHAAYSVMVATTGGIDAGSGDNAPFGARALARYAVGRPRLRRPVQQPVLCGFEGNCGEPP
jgi:hypothetical protein